MWKRPAAGTPFLAMDARLDRVSRNEAVYRAVNREIEHASEELGEGPRDRIEVICECGREGCSETLELTVAELDCADEAQLAIRRLCFQAASPCYHVTRAFIWHALPSGCNLLPHLLH